MIETKEKDQKDSLSKARELIGQLPQDLAKIWDPAESWLRKTCLDVFSELAEIEPKVIYDSGETNSIFIDEVFVCQRII